MLWSACHHNGSEKGTIRVGWPDLKTTLEARLFVFVDCKSLQFVGVNGMSCNSEVTKRRNEKLQSSEPLLAVDDLRAGDCTTDYLLHVEHDGTQEVRSPGDACGAR